MNKNQALSLLKFAFAWGCLVAALLTYFIHPVSSAALVLAAFSIAFAVAPTSW